MVDALLEELTPVSSTPGAFTEPNLKAGITLWIGERYMRIYTHDS